VELLGDFGVLADQVSDLCGELAGRAVPRLDRAEALGALVGDPGAVRRVWKLLAQLLEGRLRVGEVPEQKADDHFPSVLGGTGFSLAPAWRSCPRSGKAGSG